jgi:hypothetical protein
MEIIGIILLISLQAGSSSMVDPVFPRVTVANLPAGLDAD